MVRINAVVVSAMMLSSMTAQEYTKRTTQPIIWKHDVIHKTGSI